MSKKDCASGKIFNNGNRIIGNYNSISFTKEAFI